MNDRQHITSSVGHVEVHVIVLNPANAPLADVEEAIKGAARQSITQVRKTTS